ncbi:hypothetical protein [Methylobacterium indicum]|uniref:hypothetical protein n=1 Tax=Methylobacterium indicum TaxID=1775910 RepID=UPI0013F4C952|nr:hypothetical protein [Methylobacterium indicum]
MRSPRSGQERGLRAFGVLLSARVHPTGQEALPILSPLQDADGQDVITLARRWRACRQDDGGRPQLTPLARHPRMDNETREGAKQSRFLHFCPISTRFRHAMVEEVRDVIIGLKSCPAGHRPGSIMVS